MIKAVIYDLDNTLADTDEISYNAFKLAVRILHDAEVSESIISKIEKMYVNGISFEETLESFREKVPKNAYEVAKKTYLTNQNVSKVNPVDDDFFECLLDFGAGPQASSIGCAQAYLVTKGDFYTQRKKVHNSSFHTFFSPRYVYYVGKNETKEGAFKKIMKKRKCFPSEVLVVGDNIKREIRIGNELGMKTARFLHGRHSNEKYKNKLEKPNIEVNSIREIWEYVRDENSPDWKFMEENKSVLWDTYNSLFGYDEMKNWKSSDIKEINDGFGGLPVDALPSDFQ